VEDPGKAPCYSGRPVHLVPVGTSILRNLARAEEKQEIAEKARKCGSSEPGSREDEECGKEANSRGELYRAALAYLEESPYEASAELNAMKPWLKPKHVGRVVLFYSDTGAGRLASAILKEYLEKERIQVEEVEVEGLGKEMWKGLINLAKKLREKIMEYKGCHSLVNLTGGFKPESAYALLASGLAGAVGAYYKHEAFEETVVIPMIWSLGSDEREKLAQMITNAKGSARGDYVPLNCEDLELCDHLKKLAEATRPLGLIRYSSDDPQTIEIKEELADALLELAKATIGV